MRANLETRPRLDCWLGGDLGRESKTMSLILLIVVLVLLFGGGGGYWYSRRRL